MRVSLGRVVGATVLVLCGIYLGRRFWPIGIWPSDGFGIQKNITKAPGDVALTLYFACGPEAHTYKILLDGSERGNLRVQKMGGLDPCWKKEVYFVAPGSHSLSVVPAMAGDGSGTTQIQLERPANWVIIGRDRSEPRNLTFDVKQSEPRFL